ncbi:hypothetical protein RRG08_036280 [Elysia crispata]|uniref:Uncharacterized protein n=1 Tax=Elysia crispata TaxID=231223 RepID=A0AAE0ZU47_9GAST|nr:hypothetical protein RRG08_036280 [Elysia crispata]
MRGAKEFELLRKVQHFKDGFTAQISGQDCARVPEGVRGGNRKKGQPTGQNLFSGSLDIGQSVDRPLSTRNGDLGIEAVNQSGILIRFFPAREIPAAIFIPESKENPRTECIDVLFLERRLRVREDSCPGRGMWYRRGMDARPDGCRQDPGRCWP